MKHIIGLTGPTGSGKSSFSALAEKKGVYVIDCDKIARQVTERGSECLLKLAEVFGEDIIDEDGCLIRRLLAKKAFSSVKSTPAFLINSTGKSEPPAFNKFK